MKRIIVMTTLGVLLSLCVICTSCPISNPEIAAVSVYDLTALVSVPVRNAAVRKNIPEQPQFTGKIAWETENGPFTMKKFQSGAVYKAVVTLTAANGYSFNGVDADRFIHNYGTVTNPAGSNATAAITITVLFPKTADATDNTITDLDLTGLFKAPVKGLTPQTAIPDQKQFTATIAWQTLDGAALSGSFVPDTAYRAVLAIEPKSRWTLSDLPGGSFSYAGADVDCDVFGKTITVSFPKTARADEDTIVNDFSLTALVDFPLSGQTPPVIVDGDQYTGAIRWFTESNAALTGAFGPLTVYRAELTLTAKTGYTFTGVAGDCFTYTGAREIHNVSGSGNVTVTFDRSRPNIEYITGDRALNDCTIKACCWEKDHKWDLIFDGKYLLGDETHWDYDWEPVGTLPKIEFNSDYPHFMDALKNYIKDPETQTQPQYEAGNVSDDCGRGHVTAVMMGLFPTDENAHFINFDLGQGYTVCSLGLYPRDVNNPQAHKNIYEYKIFISDTDFISADDNQSAVNPEDHGVTLVKTGVINWTENAWYDIDLTDVDDPAVLNGRYVQLRMLHDTHNRDENDWTQPGIAELRFGVNQ